MDRFSPDAVTRLAGPPLPAARYGHSATLDGSGDLVVLGGFDSAGLSTNTCFRLPRNAVAFITCAAMPSKRAGHQAVLLDTGKILVVGAAPSGVIVESAYDPIADQWVATTLAASPASNQTVFPRNGNSILVWGGVVPASQYANAAQPKRYFSQNDYTGYLFWTDNSRPTALATMGFHAATALDDGRTLISGGSDTFGCVGATVLGCFAYGFQPSKNAYVVGKQRLLGIDDLLYGRVPYAPRAQERYRIDASFSGGWNRLPASGMASISDGTASCSFAYPATGCYLTSVVAGPKVYSFTFNGDAEYLPLNWSASRPAGDGIRIERIGAAGVIYATAGRSGVYCAAYISPADIHSCDVSVSAGSTHTLTSTPPTGYTFIGWQGVCAGSAQQCTFTTGASGSSVVKAYFAATADLPLRIDLDKSGAANALSDGRVLFKYMLDFHDAPLVNGLTGNQALAAPQAIEDQLNRMRPLLDVDQNGVVDASTDGVLFLRYLLGFRGTALIDGALGIGSRVTDPVQIGAAIQSLMP